MRRLVLIALSVVLLVPATAAPAAAFKVECTLSVTEISDPPPRKPNARWVREILDGNAADAACDAVQRALG